MFISVLGFFSWVLQPKFKIIDLSLASYENPEIIVGSCLSIVQNRSFIDGIDVLSNFKKDKEFFRFEECVKPENFSEITRSLPSILQNRSFDKEISQSLRGITQQLSAASIESQGVLSNVVNGNHSQHTPWDSGSLAITYPT